MTASKLVAAMEVISEGISEGDLYKISDGFFQLTGKRINPPNKKDPLEEAVELFSSMGDVVAEHDNSEGRESKEVDSFVMNKERPRSKGRRTKRDEEWVNTFDPNTVPDKEDPALDGIDDSKPRKKSKRPPHRIATKVCGECGNEFEITAGNSHERRCDNCLINLARR